MLSQDYALRLSALHMIDPVIKILNDNHLILLLGSLWATPV